jgi:hypothetical protein
MRVVPTVLLSYWIAYTAGCDRDLSFRLKENEMTHQRTTNILLFVIAACLVALTAKQFGIEIIPQAKAEYGTPGSQAPSVRIVGCYMRGGQCQYQEIRTNEYGAVYIANVK